MDSRSANGCSCHERRATGIGNYIATQASHSVMQRWIEISAWTAGSLLLAAYGSAELYFSYAHRQGITQFEAARARVSDLSLRRDGSGPASTVDEVERPPSSVSSPAVLKFASPDMSLWSASRVASYMRHSDRGAPVGVLQIPTLALEVPVYSELSENNMSRGAAWIGGTAPLGSTGNVGIAAHRDGYFRPLQNIRIGDAVQLQTLFGHRDYVVEDIRIVSPKEIEVLAPAAGDVLTLVTCYPFYFAGPAPKRFIVRAHPANARRTPPNRPAPG